ncbi:phage tail protein [Paenibacillus sp. FSL L8-0340]|uniref:phage tail protein n=1 Tax=Paenibacillus sp. FSL L8-0340 TaxID=2954685 RepID=UPI003158C1B5
MHPQHKPYAPTRGAFYVAHIPVITRKEDAIISTLLSLDRHLTPIGALVFADDITRTRRINADYTLSFTVPLSSADYRELLPLKGHVQDERGQYYVINKRQRNRDGRKLTAQISCTHVMYKLADYKFPYASYIAEGYGKQITQLTSLIAAATGGVFSFAVDDTFDLADVKEFGGGNCLEALNAVINLYGAEVDPDNFVIHLRKKIGDSASALQYRIGKNIVSSSASDDTSSLCTRLFAEMKDSRTWIGQPASILTADERARLEAIPGAITDGILRVNYLVSAYASAWASASVPFYDDLLTEQDVTDPLKLLEATRLRLAEREVPALEVSVSAADLYKLDSTEPRPGLGDTVTLVDPDMDLTHVNARITELTEYPYAKDKHAQVTVANVQRRDYAQIIADLESTRRAIDNVFSGGRIRAEAFEAFAAAAVKEINASKTEVKYDTRGIVAQSLVDPNDMVIVTSNGIIVSTDGGATARSAITATGVVAETVVGQFGNFVSTLIGSGNKVVQINTHGISAGHADFNSAPFRVNMAGDVVARSIKLTGEVENSEVISSVIRASQIIGNEIEGGTITGAKIQTSDSVYPRVVIDPASVAFGVYASEDSGIQIPAYDNGITRIIFNAGGGVQSTIYNSPASGLIVGGSPDVTLSGNNVRLAPSNTGHVIVAGWERLHNGSNTLADELAAIWLAIGA